LASYPNGENRVVTDEGIRFTYQRHSKWTHREIRDSLGA
jgi:hypothetical protein